MKKIVILGSTGSIGVTALRVIRQNPEKYKVVGLTAGRNVRLLLRQIAEFKPKAVAVLQEKDKEWLKSEVQDQFIEVYSGEEGFVKVATIAESDIVISSIMGAAGLIPTFSAIKAGKDIALANKETMVMAGPIVVEEVKKRGVFIIPVDSEHSAIFQSIQGHPKDDIKRVILTASGGPFKDASLEEMANVTPEQALKHPNWKMGKKITIDSATMMNKGLEVIEARWLFDIPVDKIDILVHPQSIVHSMVEYKDGSIIAQLGVPDMSIPISYALSYPHHVENDLPSLELDKIKVLSFEKPDLKRFKCIRLAYEAIKIGGSMPAVMNGANEVAVEAFLRKEIGFLDIPDIIERVMSVHEPFPVDSIASVMEADRWARQKAEDIIKSIQG
jgi:1-deoxy-D-xylulose-5-phosphate reductoisomerase